MSQSSKWSISFTPSIIANPEMKFGFQVGGVYNIAPRFQFLSSVTTGVIPFVKPVSDENKYFRFKSECRYINLKSHDWVRPYVGLQTSFVTSSWKTINSGSYYEDTFLSDSVVNFSSAKIHSSSVAATIQVGLNTEVLPHLYFDLSLGLGSKWIITKYLEVIDPIKYERLRPKCGLFLPDPAYRVNGAVSRFQINPTVSFQYRF